VLIACWAAKGGSGTTVVSVALATVLARRSPRGVLLVDLDGDVPAVLGIPEPVGPGIAGWLAAGDGVPPDALGRLEVAVAGSVSLLAAGGTLPEGGDRGEVLAALLGDEPRPVVVDCGTDPRGVGLAVAAASSQSLLVLRPCYLALRRALAAPLRPSGVVLVDEPGRALGADDVAAVLGVPVRAVVAYEPRVARAVDAGLLVDRLPAAMARALGRAA
jgi:MinD-like ATPase involved in chromosome partitioning or flagellar assembly